ncbi:hypothetical protein [Escherichia coli]|uniref:hypothetical protein n=1 Tax=Escherichia coli TaxID=562 RepID=UPI00200DE9E0|nr:hypothetical protein [Escherichia coli]MCL0243705.1 hypothetical protein [Escherichia coli]MCL0273963.1 hypothetical protein [Escherichia coli]
MSNLREYQNRIADIAKRSKAVLGWASTAQFGTDNQFIKDDAARAASILEAARKDPVFAGISDNATAQIATAWASALADYAAAHKSMPRPEILASCHQTLENCLIESTRNSMDATNKAMLESVAAEMMSVSDGVMRLPLFLAMILPVQLGAATADACTFIPVTRDQSDIYEVFNVAGSSFGSYAAGEQITVTCSLNYNIGQIALSFSKAPDKGTEIAIETEINIEAAPELIPLINHEMKKYTLFPSQFVIAAEHTVQAAYVAQREFGLDLGSLQFRTLKEYLSHEQDMLRLRIMIWRTLATDTFDIALPVNQSFDVWATIIRGKFQTVYRDIIERVKSSGAMGMFAGADAASFFKQLPKDFFQPAEDYIQTPYVHYIGTLFGNVKVYEVPAGICKNLTTENIQFSSMDVLCYVRDENPGKAGFVTGDAVPAIPFQHPTTPVLVNRTTLWGSAINDMHPRNGADYFTRVTLTMAKKGGLNFISSDTIDAGDSE